MTERVRIEHTFDCSEKAFWDTFLEEQYNKEMFLEALRFNRWDVAKLETSETSMSRVIDVEPYVPQMPGPIKRVIGDSIGYQEIGRLDRTKNHYFMEIVPSKLKDKIKMTCEQFTEVISENRVKRIFTANIHVKIFGIGSMIEKQISSDLKKSYDVGAKFTADYMNRQPIN